MQVVELTYMCITLNGVKEATSAEEYRKRLITAIYNGSFENIPRLSVFKSPTSALKKYRDDSNDYKYNGQNPRIIVEFYKRANKIFLTAFYNESPTTYDDMEINDKSMQVFSGTFIQNLYFEFQFIDNKFFNLQSLNNTKEIENYFDSYSILPNLSV